MPTDLQVYLNFDGRCEEAVAFYKQTLGAQVDVLMRGKDAPDGSCGPENGDKIMHTSFRVGGATIMASDCHSKGAPKFEGFSLTLGVPEEAECDRLVAALSAGGGKVEMPPAQTFWSPRFAVVSDRFGVSWMINTIPAGGQRQ